MRKKHKSVYKRIRNLFHLIQEKESLNKHEGILLGASDKIFDFSPIKFRRREIERKRNANCNILVSVYNIAASSLTSPLGKLTHKMNRKEKEKNR